MVSSILVPAVAAAVIVGLFVVSLRRFSRPLRVIDPSKRVPPQVSVQGRSEAPHAAGERRSPAI